MQKAFLHCPLHLYTRKLCQHDQHPDGQSLDYQLTRDVQKSSHHSNTVIVSWNGECLACAHRSLSRVATFLPTQPFKQVLIFSVCGNSLNKNHVCKCRATFVFYPARMVHHMFLPTNCVGLIGESSDSEVARDVGERLPFFWDTTLSSGSSVTDVSTQIMASYSALEIRTDVTL